MVGLITVFPHGCHGWRARERSAKHANCTAALALPRVGAGSVNGGSAACLGGTRALPSGPHGGGATAVGSIARHSQTAAVPAERLVEERALFRPLPSLRRGERRRVDKLCCVRIGSARYSVPRELIGRDVSAIAAEGLVVVEHHGVVVAHHPLVAPGEVSLVDEHYGGPRRGPARALRPRSGAERAFLALGPVAEAFVRNAAAAAPPSWPTSLAPSPPSKRPGAATPWWPRSVEPSSSVASRPPTCAPSSRRASVSPTSSPRGAARPTIRRGRRVDIVTCR